jgi:hypothetical protein
MTEQPHAANGLFVVLVGDYLCRAALLADPAHALDPGKAGIDSSSVRLVVA